MNLDQHIQSLIKLGQQIVQFDDSDLSNIIHQAYVQNNWFDQDEMKHCLTAWSKQLTEENLIEWTSRYDFSKKADPKNVGLILAGNIPLVGLHDIICVLLSGNKALVKLSSKDTFMIKFIIFSLYQIDEAYKERIEIVERLTDHDAIIATGSNNSSRYFEHYFDKYPNIIRKNRTSIALLDGKESKAQLEAMGNDIFRYFGLGCRNISKIYVPQDYKLDPIFEAVASFEPIMHNNKYKNNYDYNCTLLLMNQVKFLSNDFLMLKEDASFHAPTGTVHIERYTDQADLKAKIDAINLDTIQCISSDHIDGTNHIQLGQCQHPQLWDYADNIDTMEFLLGLKDVINDV
jgi:hypothetical protein